MSLDTHGRSGDHAGRSTEKVLGYIDIAKKEGAKLMLGGGPAARPECGKGWFVEPTVFRR